MIIKQDDNEKRLFDGKKITTEFNNDDVLKQNYEGRKMSGFDAGRHIRCVAHIEMNTVRMLAYKNHDEDAFNYLEYHDTAARDRMIKKYPILFKACSGGI
ncbi:hypothetical protein [Pectinatus frisingensis]|uniref:hypothetical protein n=1 Tax=Pectinatus frisingensis TaxID=865 RepID=UPI0018C812B0|nr:hypothetical protein [Pectinatus frisingensis]